MTDIYHDAQGQGPMGTDRGKDPIKDETDKQIVTDPMKEASDRNMFGLGQMEKPGTYEVEYKTGSEARAPTNTDIVPADRIYVSEQGKMTFAAGGDIQLRFPADRLVSIDHLQNTAPFLDFLHEVQQDFVRDTSDRVALLPRDVGATTALAATALKRAHGGQDVLLLTHNRNEASSFVQDFVHNVAIEMSVDVSHHHETSASVGESKIWADNYGNGPLRSRDPDVVLGDRLERQEAKHVRGVLEDSRVQELAFAGTGGHKVYGNDSALRRVLQSKHIENVYWFGNDALQRTDMNEKLS